MYYGIVFEVVCGDFGVVSGDLRWFAIFHWTETSVPLPRKFKPGAGKYDWSPYHFSPLAESQAL